MHIHTSKETIWHFTCKTCKGFWSIATMDEWVPRHLYCPHCGKLSSYQLQGVDE